MDGVYLATSASPDLPGLKRNLAVEAAAGVSSFVKLSVIGAEPRSRLTYARVHHASEEYVKASGVPWTMVRPNGFMQDTLSWAEQIETGTVRAPVVDAKWSIVDVRDVARVAVSALRDPATHTGRTYTLSGPEAISPRQQVGILADLLGLRLVCEDVPVEVATAAMLRAGASHWSVERIAELLEFYRRDEAVALSSDVETVTGQRARADTEFATDHLSAIVGNAA